MGRGGGEICGGGIDPGCEYIWERNDGDRRCALRARAARTVSDQEKWVRIGEERMMGQREWACLSPNTLNRDSVFGSLSKVN